MKRRTYYRVNHVGNVETQTFTARSKAHTGGWSTNKAVAIRRASIVPMNPVDRVKVLADSLGLKYNRDQMRTKAKEAEIVGRGRMNKDQLCSAVAEVRVQAGA